MDNELIVYKKVPVLPIRGIVIFPGSVLHFDIARSASVKAVTDAMQTMRHIFISAQTDTTVSEPGANDLYRIGVYSKLLQVVKLNENVLRVAVEGESRTRAVSFYQENGYITADLSEPDQINTENTMNTEAMVNILKDLVQSYAVLMPHIPQDIITTVYETTDGGKLADYIADNLIRDYHQKQQALAEFDVTKRMELVISQLTHELGVLEIEEEINERTREGMDQNQKDYYLREKLKAIHEELGDADDDIGAEIAEYRKKISELKTTDENKEKLMKEVGRLEKTMYSSPEANVIRTYLDTCLGLPWGVYDKEKMDIRRIEKHLEKNHYGLKKVKESVIEALAVRKLNPDINGQIICLSGPPGVGKTSIARSIAEATGRKYQRIALGGVHDEAEIRGHRKTYIGAMMGRIMAAIDQAKSANPVILLDEVDKLGQDYHGDPTSALLEVLDGEQNSTFHDHYIDLAFDLSKVMFITTANDDSVIPAALRDRMDIIPISSYTREEKYQIAKQHLIAKQLKRHGLTGRNFKITDEAIYCLIDNYVRESGVRNLERVISVLMNKTAVRILAGEVKSVKVNEDDLEEMIGAKRYKTDELNVRDEVGLATGLAWTSVGGETLPIEVAVMEGTGKLELTGSLGDVMKESAQAAYTCIRSMSDELHIANDFYKTKDIHIHVPEGAVPKDGPSAGITMATAITSALTNRPVRHDLAMTGEITIRGRVLPIGGLKEKTMAAYRLGIKTVIIPEENKADLTEVDEVVKDSIRFVLADNIRTVLNTALTTEQQGV